MSVEPMLGLGEAEWQAILLSLRVAFWATFASLPIAIFVAHALARWEFAGKQLVNGLVHLPLILPPVVTGYLLLVAFGANGVFGQFLLETTGFTFAFNWTGAALAAAVMAFPLMVRAIRLAIESVDRGLEAAASTLGASRRRVYTTITLPLILPGILVGSVLAFARAMGEFGATITFVANIPGETRTLPSAIYTFLQVPGGENSVWRLVLISIAISISALVMSELMARRLNDRLGRSSSTSA